MLQIVTDEKLHLLVLRYPAKYGDPVTDMLRKSYLFGAESCMIESNHPTHNDNELWQLIVFVADTIHDAVLTDIRKIVEQEKS